ncbi:MAG: phosphatase PAP2 family protein [Thermodesulfobacteriota bacterium]|nr:phosphatase PAP2 family protein [Thermodesulfobacteriota bacterium]
MWNLERPSRRVFALLSLALGLVLVGLHDADLAQALKFDHGRGEIFSRMGYWLGHGLVQGVLFFLLYLAGRFLARPGLKAVGARAFIALAASGLLTQVLKHLVGRPRPRLWSQGVSHFGPSLTSGLDSFPSGHTATSMAAALVLSYYYPKSAPLFMFGAAFVGVARLIGGSHFPLDVLGGAALGLAVGWAVIVYLPAGGNHLGPAEEHL